jgi:hypothetical protein
MDVRVGAVVMTAGAVMNESKTTVMVVSDIVICAPVVSRFSLTPVISVGGKSISSINPEFSKGGIKATA